MNKAILVIDMPSCCNECSLMWEDEYSYYCPVRLHENITDLYRDYIITSDKPEWCPLRPIPTKYNMKDVVFDRDYDGDYEYGYNACIDEILWGR